MSVFGPLVTPTAVEDALLATLKEHLEQYLGETGRVTGRGQNVMPMPRHWAIPEGTYDTWPEETPPIIALESPGTDGDADEDAEGGVSIWRLFGLVIVVEANHEKAADRLAKDYAYAVAWCLSQQRPPDPIHRVRFLGDRFDDLPLDDDKRRSMAMARLRFRAYVPDIFNRKMGPRGPVPAEPRDPHPDPAVATSFNFDVAPE